MPVRKLGKLPAETISVEYALEYGTNTLEIHKDAIEPGQKVLIVDDLLATGGTVLGTIELVKQLKGEIVGLSFLVELNFLKGRDRLVTTTSTASSSTEGPEPERGGGPGPTASGDAATEPTTESGDTLVGALPAIPPPARRPARRPTMTPGGGSSSGSSAGRRSRP